MSRVGAIGQQDGLGVSPLIQPGAADPRCKETKAKDNAGVRAGDGCSMGRGFTAEIKWEEQICVEE